jgi:hypothetical protein
MRVTSLQGCVVFVTVADGTDGDYEGPENNPALAELECKLAALGATLAPTLADDVTLVVFKKGARELLMTHNKKSCAYAAFTTARAKSKSSRPRRSSPARGCSPASAKAVERWSAPSPVPSRHQRQLLLLPASSLLLLILTLLQPATRQRPRPFFFTANAGLLVKGQSQRLWRTTTSSNESCRTYPRPATSLAAPVSTERSARRPRRRRCGART